VATDGPALSALAIKGFTDGSEDGVGQASRASIVPFSDEQPNDLFSALRAYMGPERGDSDARWARTYALAPPVSPDYLAQVFGESGVLPQIEDAIGRNVEERGYDLVPVRKARPDTPPAIEAAMRAERVRLRAFFRGAAEWPCSWEESLRRARKDYEVTGWRGFQVLRMAPPGFRVGDKQPLAFDPALTDPFGAMVGFQHIEAGTLRWCEASDPILTSVWEYEEDEEAGEPDLAATPRWVERKTWRRFRLIAHARTAGFTRLVGSGNVQNGTVVYFREFGDPRVIDKRDGTVLGNYLTGEFPDQAVLDTDGRPKWGPQWWANEVLIDSNYFPGWAPYGRPWWVGVSETDMALTAAAEANRTGIESPKIPRLILTSEGTKTTGAALNFARERIEKGRADDPGAQFRMVLIETSPHTLGAIGDSTERGIRPQLNVHQIKVLPDDGLFVDFDEQGRKKVRSARRLPPIFLGLSEDDSYASASASILAGDEQVFQPERDRLDNLINKAVLTSLRAVWWRYRTRGALTVAVADKVRAVEVGDKAGALTPNKVREVMADLLGVELEAIPEGWGDRPFAVTLAEAQAQARLGLAPGAGVDEGETVEGGEGEGATKAAGDDAMVAALRSLRSALAAKCAAGVRR
jgi:capsid portal protein